MARRIPKIRWEVLIGDKEFKFKALNTVIRESKRYKKTTTVLTGDKSDGATGAWDIVSDAWGHHDTLCSKGCWDDGTKLCNVQASFELSDILFEEGRYFRSIYWFFATLLFGGGEARKNGMFWVKK